jgi:broad specificity phosphatase PhoE
MRPPDFRTLPARCDFYFVRHGESESNADGRIQGHSDSPLSALGEEHAEAAGSWFAERKIDALLTSPLSRARQTAAAIARHTGAAEPEIVRELIELDTGIYSGERLGDLESLDPELYRAFRVHSWEAVPEAERIDSLLRRAGVVWSRLLALATAGRRSIVCVSHGGMIQWLIKATLGAFEQRWMPLFKVSNCGIYQFRAEPALRADESASHAAGHDDTTHEPGTGYFGTWVEMNRVPYETK